MDWMEKVRTAFERNARAMELRPGIGRGTAVTKVKVVDGLTCSVEEGPWTLTVDMAEKWGGTSAGPNPGVLGRGALGSCLAIGYMMWAARLHVPIQHLEVEVHADYDSGGSYGLSDVTPAYTSVRYIVTVESTASEEEIVRVLDKADAHSSYRAVFAEPQPVTREVRVLTPRSR